MSTQTSTDSAGPVVHLAHDAAAQAQDVAAMVADGLRAALAERPRATLVVSGGKTPVAMWQSLRQQDLDWQRVDVTLADERWVPTDHPASNEALVRQHLLQARARTAHWVPLYNPGEEAGESLEAALPRLEARLASQLNWPADVVVLGMGADGHTASWFPGQALPDDGSRCLAVPAPQAPNVAVPRVSLSPAALLDARCLIVQSQGKDKDAMLLQALQPASAEDEQALQERLPIRRAFWARGVTCHVFHAS
jgi:6-phosphogluconolactonase